MIDDLERPSELERAWQSHARAALDWRDGEPIAPVLEALALSVAIDAIGALGDLPRRAREDLLRVGRRALLHAAEPPPSGIEEDPEDREDAVEAHRIALALARDGLRALSGRPVEDDVAGPRVGRPSPRDLARLVSGRIDAYEAARVGRALRAWPEARAELRWALRNLGGRSEAERASGDRTPRLLAAADGELMRDPAGGRRVAIVSEPGSGATIVELYAFGGADITALAAYCIDDAPLRVEAPGVRTELMQPGYWAGALEGAEADGERELTIYVGDARHVVRVTLA